MAFSMFASVAAAAEPTTTLEKYEALKAQGIFEGTDGDKPALEDAMTRAQFAKIINKLKGLNEDAAAAAAYTDLEGSGWAAGFIGAATKANLMEGVSDVPLKFLPTGNVTVEQLATVLDRAFGIAPTPGASVSGNVSNWAEGYVAAAIANGLIAKQSDYTAPALRGQLVDATYTAWQMIEDAQKVSLKEVKAAGVQKVTVSFNKAVDTAKAQLSLKKGSTIAVATSVKWADDKKSATLTLTNTKLSAGQYTVTLGGYESSAVGTTSLSFDAQDEAVQKIEFLTTSDYIAQASKSIVKLKATNQYGENASFSAGSYNAFISPNITYSLTKGDDGLLNLSLDTEALRPNLDIVSVNIYHTDNRATVSKNFTVGTAPFVQKMELGDVKYSVDSAINKRGETATFDLKLYDQYGNIVPHSVEVEKNVQVLFTPFENKLEYNVKDHNSDGITDVRVSLNKEVDKSGTYTAQVYYQGASATATINVNSSKVATKLEIGELGDVIAAGDQDVYIPLIAYDANGNQLSTEDLISDTNAKRIELSVSGAKSVELMTSGENKGKIHLSEITAQSRSMVSVTAYIPTVPNSYVSRQYTVNNVRTPDHLEITTEPSKKIVAGAYSKFVVKVIDQYGKSMDTAKDVAGASYIAKLVQKDTNGDTKFIAEDASPTDILKPKAGETSIVYDNKGDNTFKQLSKTKRFVTTAGATDTMSFTVELYKVVGGNPTLLNSVSRQVEVVPSDETGLTYQVDAVQPLFNAGDSSSVTGVTYGYNADKTEQQITLAEQRKASVSKFARQVIVSATSPSGDKVALPDTITAITSSNTSVANVELVGNKAYVIGNKAGTATLNVSFKTVNGLTKQATVEVTVKSDSISVTKVAAGNTSVQPIKATGDNAFVVMNLDVTDNYGVVYNKMNAAKYNYLLAVNFSVSNVQGGSVTVDQYGQISVTANADNKTGEVTFDLTATSATGKSATTPIKASTK